MLSYSAITDDLCPAGCYKQSCKLDIATFTLTVGVLVLILWWSMLQYYLAVYYFAIQFLTYYMTIMQLDVYTCGPFDPKTVLDAIEQFDVVKIDYKYLDRESGFQELSL